VTPEQRAALAARLQQPDMAGLSVAEAAAALSAPGSGAGITHVPIAGEAIFETLTEAGVWGAIKLWSRAMPTGTVAAPSAQDAMAARCINVVDAAEQRIALRTNREGVRTRWAGIFDGLRTDGLLTAGQRNSLNALAQRASTWAEDNGLGERVTEAQVRRARDIPEIVQEG
jgi:hypothetical protein